MNLHFALQALTDLSWSLAVLVPYVSQLVCSHCAAACHPLVVARWEIKLRGSRDNFVCESKVEPSGQQNPGSKLSPSLSNSWWE